MSTATYQIEGMTCGHCVKSVEEALGSLDGVTSVQVSLEDRRAVVTSEDELDTATVRRAVEEAGYQLAS